MTGHRPDDRFHFVMKRGHLGRYRFTLMMDDARLTGEVQTGSGWEDRARQDQHAFNEIARLAKILGAKAATEVETHDDFDHQEFDGAGNGR